METTLESNFRPKIFWPQQPSLDQQEREALQEIQRDINERIENAVEIAFENPLFAEAEANAFNYDVGRP